MASLLLCWYADGHLRAAPPAGNSHFTAKRLRALPHSHNSERLSPRQLLGFDASAIVSDGNDGRRSVDSLTDTQFRRAGVSNGIGHGFLHDPKDRRPLVGLGLGVESLQDHLATNARAFLHVLCEPFDRGTEAHVVQEARTKVAADSPHCLDRGVDAPNRRGVAPPRLANLFVVRN